MISYAFNYWPVMVPAILVSQCRCHGRETFIRRPRRPLVRIDVALMRRRR